MGKAKKKQQARQKFAVMKKMITQYDSRIKDKDRTKRKTKIDLTKPKISKTPQMSTAMFFEYNTQLGPIASTSSTRIATRPSISRSMG